MTQRRHTSNFSRNNKGILPLSSDRGFFSKESFLVRSCPLGLMIFMDFHGSMKALKGPLIALLYWATLFCLWNLQSIYCSLPKWESSLWSKWSMLTITLSTRCSCSKLRYWKCKPAFQEVILNENSLILLDSNFKAPWIQGLNSVYKRVNNNIIYRIHWIMIERWKQYYIVFM